MNGLSQPLVPRAKAVCRAAATFALILGVLGGCATQNVAPPQETAQQEPAEPEAPEVIAGPAETPVEPEPVAPSVPQVPESLRALGKVPIALLVPMTGRAGALGKAMVEAAEMALFEAGNADVILLPKDTAGDPGIAARAAEEAVGEGARLIVGPLFASSVRAVTPVAQSAGIVVLAFSNDRSAASDGVYLLGFTPGDQVRRVVAFAMERGNRHFGAVVPSNEYGRLVVDTMRQTLEQAGKTLEQPSYFSPGETDFTQPIRSLSQNAPLLDTIMVAAGGQQLRGAAPLLPFYGYDPAQVKLLGTGLWDDPEIAAEPALLGGWFAAPPPEARTAYERRFQHYFGHDAPRLTSLAYDATALAAALAGLPGDQNFSRETLESERGFAGTEGIFRLGTGGVAERGLAILEVTASGFRVIDPAPKSFGPALTQ
ncbi:MAG: penicillin-binding protein activator [Rhodospirillaceae bacterium]|nr:penicillin-binding protein activator [Rhodospirillaceae bacterium]